MRGYAERERKHELEQLAEHSPDGHEAVERVGRQSVLELQRTAGNNAVSALLGELAPKAEAGATGPQVSEDTHAEHEADQIADAAVTKLGGEASKAPIVDGTLSPTLRRALGAVAPDVGAVGQIRVHTDDHASAQADSINARAFTHGRDVSVATGELNNHVEGHRLLAHEAVHAARHQPATGGDLVHAKLRGTKDAMVNMGGGETSGKVRKLVNIKTNWDQLVEALGAYEELEGALLKSGNPSATALSKVKPKLIKQLGKVESACVAWEKANKGESKARTRERQDKLKAGQTVEQEDDRLKAERRQAVAMLMPRVRAEIEDLMSDRWAKGLGLSDEKLTGTGAKKAGQVNPVKELKYATESGEFAGYFKAEHGFNKKMQGQEAAVGIKQADPNYGKRAVAMYRIDQLLGAEVTARTEFATHDGVLGTVSETVVGDQGGEALFANDEEEKEALGPGAILSTDPVLQRSLNKLQILDAICGQLDRHSNNWLVQTDEKGGVTGVKGIDLDMAFGEDMEDVEVDMGNLGHNFRGLPPIIDEEFALKVVKVKADDIRNALKGLLSDKEIDATVKRFQKVVDRINRIPKEELVKNWDQSTSMANRAKKAAASSEHKSYTSKVSGGVVLDAIDRMSDEITYALTGAKGTPPFNPQLARRLRVLPEKTAQGFREAVRGVIRELTIPKAWDTTIPTGKLIPLAMEMLNQVLGDQTLMGQLELQAMENTDTKMNVGVAMYPLLRPKLETYLQVWLQRQR